MSNIFGSSLLYFVLEQILACSPLQYLLWPSYLLATPRESVMLDCGFSPLMSSLSDRNIRLGDVLLPPGIKQWSLYLRVQGLLTLRAVATRDKTTVLVPAGARIAYFTQSSFNEVVCCFEFTLWVGFATLYLRGVLD